MSTFRLTIKSLALLFFVLSSLTIYAQCKGREEKKFLGNVTKGLDPKIKFGKQFPKGIQSDTISNENRLCQRDSVFHIFTKRNLKGNFLNLEGKLTIEEIDSNVHFIYFTATNIDSMNFANIAALVKEKLGPIEVFTEDVFLIIFKFKNCDSSVIGLYYNKIDKKLNFHIADDYFSRYLEF
jgi:hypothetical protein